MLLGNHLLSLLQIPHLATISKPHSINNLLPIYPYLGCYSPASDTRSFSTVAESRIPMSRDICSHLCSSYKYAAIDWKTCLCGDTFDTELEKFGDKLCASEEAPLRDLGFFAVYQVWQQQKPSDDQPESQRPSPLKPAHVLGSERFSGSESAQIATDSIFKPETSKVSIVTTTVICMDCNADGVYTLTKSQVPALPSTLAKTKAELDGTSQKNHAQVVLGSGSGGQGQGAESKDSDLSSTSSGNFSWSGNCIDRWILAIGLLAVFLAI